MYCPCYKCLCTFYCPATEITPLLILKIYIIINIYKFKCFDINVEIINKKLNDVIISNSKVATYILICKGMCIQKYRT